MRPNVNVTVGGPIKPTNYTYKTVILKSNLPFAAQVGDPNCIYVIKWDFDLGGSEVTIPENCILKFEGGSLRNGAVIGNGTQIIAPKVSIFTGITIEGTWNVPDITSAWFSDAEEPDKLIDVFALQDDNIFNTLVVEEGDYIVTRGASSACLSCKSNLKLIINGNISLAPTSQSRYYILSVYGASNVEITGVGTIIGDKFGHDYDSGALSLGPKILSTDASNTPKGVKLYSGNDFVVGTLEPSQSIADANYVYWVRNNCVAGGIYTYYKCIESGSTYVFSAVNTHEHGMGVDIRMASTGVRVSGINIKDCTGDGIYIGNSGADIGFLNKDIVVDGVTIDGCRRQGISLTDVNLCEVRNCTITNIKGTNPQSAVDVEPNANHECKYVLIENNNFHNNTLGVVSNVNGSNIENTFVSNVIIRNNNIDCDNGGVVAHYMSGLLEVENNTIKCRYAAVKITGDTPLTQAYLTNNTIESTIEASDIDFDLGMPTLYFWGCYRTTFSGNKVTTKAESVFFARYDCNILDNEVYTNAELFKHNRTTRGLYIIENNTFSTDTSWALTCNVVLCNNKFNVLDGVHNVRIIIDANNLDQGIKQQRIQNNYFRNTQLFVDARYYITHTITSGNQFVYDENYVYVPAQDDPTYLLRNNGMFKDNVIELNEESTIGSGCSVIYSGSDANTEIKNNTFYLGDKVLRCVVNIGNINSCVINNRIYQDSGVRSYIRGNVYTFADGTFWNRGGVSDRPLLPNDTVFKGFCFYDTSLNKEIYYTCTPTEVLHNVTLPHGTSTFIQNNLTEGELYYVGVANPNGPSSDVQVYFAKTDTEPTESDLLLVLNGSSNYITVADPVTYPYILIKNIDDDTVRYITIMEVAEWTESDSAAAGVLRKGAFADKPAPADIYEGFKYFCTDKQSPEQAAIDPTVFGIEIIYKGDNVWVDALGRVITE